ncbi:fluoride efflux transporter FluC [Streptomyces formicae]|uniref:Fluoride-specific ion channel FluC n=1 Tax=Streptomyces formicae TaxID=1616117 RepID=A0A291QLY9_9ACTN|nr:Protein crcB-like protein [Streptomyces formicae]
MPRQDPRPAAVDAPMDPDVDLSVPAERGGLTRGQGGVLAAVSVGGAIGASARYAASLHWPVAPGGFPWATLAVNAVGCALIGVLMVLVTEVWTPHRLVRPFLGTGVLGGFTTFSTYTVDIERLLSGGYARTGLAYLALTLLAAVAAVWGAVRVTRRLTRRLTEGRGR